MSANNDIAGYMAIPYLFVMVIMLRKNGEGEQEMVYKANDEAKDLSLSTIF